MPTACIAITSRASIPRYKKCADTLHLSQDLGMQKPDSDIYRYALKQGETMADDAVFFNDNADKISAACQGDIR
ncbi:MAG: hypothetical protein ACTXOO_05735 [Sodalis sp. (in: enterobacteria)]